MVFFSLSKFFYLFQSTTIRRRRKKCESFHFLRQKQSSESIDSSRPLCPLAGLSLPRKWQAEGRPGSTPAPCRAGASEASPFACIVRLFWKRTRGRNRFFSFFFFCNLWTSKPAQHLPLLLLFHLSLSLQNQKTAVLVLLVVALGMVGQIKTPWQVRLRRRGGRRGRSRGKRVLLLPFFGIFLSSKPQPLPSQKKKKQNYLWAFLAYGPILMLTVLIHELGHCFASRSVGAPVHGKRGKNY